MVDSSVNTSWHDCLSTENVKKVQTWKLVREIWGVWQSHMTPTKKSPGFPTAKWKDCLDLEGSHGTAVGDGDASRGSSWPWLSWRPEREERDRLEPLLAGRGTVVVGCSVGSGSPPSSFWWSEQLDSLLRLPVRAVRRVNACNNVLTLSSVLFVAHSGDQISAPPPPLVTWPADWLFCKMLNLQIWMI